MPTQAATSSWFNPLSLNSRLDSAWEHREFTRLWRGFMVARVVIAVVLLLLQLGLVGMGQSPHIWQVLLCGVYFAATLWSLTMTSPQRLGRHLDVQWLLVIGVDVLAFMGLHFSVGTPIHYTPLLVLPVLLASLLGSLVLALGTSASITLLLLAHSLWLSQHAPNDFTPHLLQSALTGAGLFIIALLAHQLSARLLNLAQRARRHQFAAHIQQEVNGLVIESLSDGILVVDARGTVHAANPAARRMLQTGDTPLTAASFDLHTQPGWYALVEMTYRVFGHTQAELAQDIQIQHDTLGPRRLHARTRLTGIPWGDGANLSVIFLQDLRELEARVRTEKLASMGRMSAAVAHEIRNPLAAIAQANALLEEDLGEVPHKRLTRIIAQNATRLEKIVDDILNLARAGSTLDAAAAPLINLNASVSRVCSDWAAQSSCGAALSCQMGGAAFWVRFEEDHLRRVLVNLLDNAQRYASLQAESIQVTLHPGRAGQVTLSVWSDGAPMEQSVQQHVFEPFFSSESRSSGLGLYICRTLCERHAASISFQRVTRTARHGEVAGNAFDIGLPCTDAGHDNVG